MRPHVEFDAAVSVAVGVLGRGHVIGTRQVQGEHFSVLILQDGKGTPRDEQQAPVVVAVEVTVARAPLAIEAVSDIDDRPREIIPGPWYMWFL